MVYNHWLISVFCFSQIFVIPKTKKKIIVCFVFRGTRTHVHGMENAMSVDIL